MNPGISLILVAGLSFCFSPTQGQRPDASARATAALSDSEVAAAIELGRSSSGPFGYVAMSGTTLQVLALGPVGRIATAAAKAKRTYHAFSAESVSTALRAPVLVVTASPRPFQGRMLFEVENVVIRGQSLERQDSVLVQPVRVERLPTTWTNRFGAGLVVQDVWAYFDKSVLSLKDLVIVVVTNTGEAKFRVKDKDREKLR